MPTPPPNDAVLGAFQEGVDAFAVRAGAVDLETLACGTWSGHDLVRHVASVVAWYHQWLDRGMAGDAALPFDPSEFPWRNDADVHARAGDTTEDTLREFAEQASAYAHRAAEHWDLPYGYPGGTVTVGLHAGAAATEWHVHTWDLARAAGEDHRPSDPAVLFGAAGACVSVARGGVVGRVQGRIVPVVGRIRPWEQILRASGRSLRQCASLTGCDVG